MTKKKQTKPLRLSVACGQNIPEGFVGMDIAPIKGVKYVGNILDFSSNSVWRELEDNSVDEIECSHFVEHIPHGDGFHDPFFQFFDEIHRVLKPAEFDPANPNIPTKGFMRIVCPYYSSIRAWQDPTHQRAISEASFLYLNEEWRKANRLDHYDVHCDFDFFYNYALDPSLGNRNAEFQGEAIKSKINSVSDIQVTLVKRSK